MARRDLSMEKSALKVMVEADRLAKPADVLSLTTGNKRRLEGGLLLLQLCPRLSWAQLSATGHRSRLIYLSVTSVLTFKMGIFAKY